MRIPGSRAGRRGRAWKGKKRAEGGAGGACRGVTPVGLLVRGDERAALAAMEVVMVHREELVMGLVTGAIGARVSLSVGANVDG